VPQAKLYVRRETARGGRRARGLATGLLPRGDYNTTTATATLFLS
jgi:hypothetical protein